MVNLEYRFKLLQNKKLETVQKAKENEEILRSDAKILKEELTKYREIGNEIQEKLKEINVELATYKNLLHDRESEYTKVKKELENNNEENASGIKNKRIIEGDLDLIKDYKKKIDLEIIRLKEMNETTGKSAEIIRNKEHNLIIQIDNLKKELALLEDKLSLAKKKQLAQSNNIESVQSEKINIQSDVEKLVETNSKFKQDNIQLFTQLENVKNDFDLLNKRYNESEVVLNDKINELNIIYSEIKEANKKENDLQLQEANLQSENINLKAELEKLKYELEFQMKIREVQKEEQIHFEKNKQEIEMIAISKDLMARTAKKELEQMKMSQEHLLNDHTQLNSQLDALRKHAEVLETHNAMVIS